MYTVYSCQGVPFITNTMNCLKGRDLKYYVYVGLLKQIMDHRKSTGSVPSNKICFASDNHGFFPNVISNNVVANASNRVVE